METPADAARLIDFLNSRSTGAKPDGLGSPESAKRLLRELGIRGAQVDAAALERLRTFRDALSTLADRDGSKRGRIRAWASINEIAAAVPATVRFVSDDECDLAPAGTGVDAALGTLVADLHAAVKGGHWTRVRLCAYEPCRDAFYDTTRSRTQRWHSYALCGNRANVASHRRRSAAIADVQ
jgi:predicted RNA-binding Zn ribbon-like protein